MQVQRSGIYHGHIDENDHDRTLRKKQHRLSVPSACGARGSKQFTRVGTASASSMHQTSLQGRVPRASAIPRLLGAAGTAVFLSCKRRMHGCPCRNGLAMADHKAAGMLKRACIIEQMEE
eukprot:6175619-Pleurochrysis_carterae.AAC.3